MVDEIKKPDDAKPPTAPPCCGSCPYYDSKVLGLCLTTERLQWLPGACRGGPFTEAAAWGHVDADIDWCAAHPQIVLVAQRMKDLSSRAVMLDSMSLVIDRLREMFEGFNPGR